MLAGGILCIAAHGVWVNGKPVIPITGGPSNAGDVLALGSNHLAMFTVSRAECG